MAKETDPVQLDRQNRFMSSLAMPGTSGSYAYTNIYSVYGKMVNYAVSVSFAPVGPTPVVIPPLASPAAIVSSDAPVNATQILNVVNSTQLDQPVKATRFPQFYPHYPFYVLPFNYIPQTNVGNKRPDTNSRTFVKL
jgi:hypothetical protein